MTGMYDENITRENLKKCAKTEAMASQRILWFLCEFACRAPYSVMGGTFYFVGAGLSFFFGGVRFGGFRVGV